MAGKLIIFWDYDTQWGADRSRSPGGAKTWGNLEFENTERLLELHAQYGVPACFAVVGAAAWRENGRTTIQTKSASSTCKDTKLPVTPCTTNGCLAWDRPTSSVAEKQ